MARTVYRHLPPRPADASLGAPTPLIPGLWYFAGRFTLHGLAPDGSEMILMPNQYENREDIAIDAAWRSSDDGDQHRCWRTTSIYQHIGQHRRLLRFIRADPWTGLPVLANPGGPSLRSFIDCNRDGLYQVCSNAGRTTASSRVRAKFETLVYQWALHLATALEFIHHYSFELPTPRIAIVFGDLSIDSCWLSPGFSLSLLGFSDSCFRTRTLPVQAYPGDILTGEPFAPLLDVVDRGRKPTMQTDLFLWGCVVYELMTGYWPGRGQGLTDQEIEMLVSRRDWPELEKECLGDMVIKCWSGEITTAAELVTTVRRSITDLGAVIGEGDEVEDVHTGGLTIPGPGWSWSTAWTCHILSLVFGTMTLETAL